MHQQRQSRHGLWSSHWIFVLAATGAAVGLGNIWKFPYIAGENGGGAFVVLYLICIVIIGIPLMMAEILLGRRGRQNPVAAMQTIALENNRSRHWKIAGAIGVLAGFLILTYYSVIAGWALSYVFRAASGAFTQASATTINDMFTQFIANPWRLLLWHTIIVASTGFVIARGIRKGIEEAILVMFPLMMLFLLILVAYAVNSGYFSQGLHFLFSPDFSKLSAEGFLDALGHAFFTLSLSTGSIMMYGAYLPQNASVTKAAVAIAAADTGVALLAGLAIFPIVFANQLSPSAGPGLIFQTLPIAFGHMAYGQAFATLFFIMLVFAAFTSTISLLEPAVAWLIERLNISRQRAALLITGSIWFLGIGTVLSFNVWKHVRFFGKDIFDCLDYLTANIMLPLGGLLVVIFTGWLLKRADALDELQIPDRWVFAKWRFTIRYLSPVAILVVFVKAVGLF